MPTPPKKPPPPTDAFLLETATMLTPAILAKDPQGIAWDATTIASNAFDLAEALLEQARLRSYARAD